jgi:hypothetical protein
MLISEKQHAANRQNAQHSSGPKTPEGRAAIRFNALTYGLRTRATLLARENGAEYSQLWDELEADWQPQNRTERCHLETMVTSQWLLKRVAESESLIYEHITFSENQLKMLAYVAKQRAQLERSFRTAIADMKQSQNERQSQPQAQPGQPAQPAKPAAAPPPPPTQPDVPTPAYLMSQMTEAHAAFCSPITPIAVSNSAPLVFDNLANDSPHQALSVSLPPCKENPGPRSLTLAPASEASPTHHPSPITHHLL